MTRTSRTLLILVLMSIGTVVVLAMMAQRYSQVLEARQTAEGSETRPEQGETGELPDVEASRYVAAYLGVMSSMKRAMSEIDGETSDEAAVADLRGAFGRALSEQGMDRAGFQEMDGVVRAWEAGSPEVPDAYRRELDRRAAEVRSSRLEGYDPLER